MITFEAAIKGSLKKWEDALKVLTTGASYPQFIARGLRNRCALCEYAWARWYAGDDDDIPSQCTCCPWTEVFKHSCTKGAWYEALNFIYDTDDGDKRLEEIIHYVIGCLKTIKRLYTKATG